MIPLRSTTRAFARATWRVSYHQNSYPLRGVSTVNPHRIGGIFEPFLEQNARNKGNTIEEQAKDNEGATVNVKKLFLKDVLASDDKLKARTQHKLTSLSVDEQKRIIELVLERLKDGTVPEDHILRMAKSKPTELTTLAQTIVTEPYGAPVALELFRIAMAGGDDTAAFGYGTMLYRGRPGIVKDEAKGVEILTNLARKGHPHAQLNLASIYMREAKQSKQALELYELAGRGGANSAWAELGRIYRYGKGEIEKSHEKALHYFQRGHDAGNAQCTFMLGVYYGSNEYFPNPDSQKAFSYFEKAAMKGLAEAQYNVGFRYFTGDGVQQDYKMAVEYWKMASAQGFQLAQINLGNMYLEGRGISRDLIQARRLFEAAITRGGPIGKGALKSLKVLETLEKENNNTKDNGDSKGGSYCRIM
ncbi:uncharacterized protein VTP21DRAFT_8369 [Calcarisporiella thermophila]|uniref:uncharacterized protein n=1 Tax=Calcarisporiella thermophila TaxID=911321 RepID=UPI0037426136